MGLPVDCGFELYWKSKPGQRNLITDVTGIKVGHVTKKDGDINTGVTAVLPHDGNIFKEKVLAGVSVINGFGKSVGLVQVEELGTIETPILLTNTLSVGTATTGLVKYMLRDNEDIGVSTGTVNCLVTECNDGTLNDIRGFHVSEEDVELALKKAKTEGESFEEGAVGGGTGMVCLGLKGGIGSASRLVELDDKSYTIGVLVMSNFGAPGNLVIGGKHYDTKLAKKMFAAEEEQAAPGKEDDKDSGKDEDKDKGSIIILIATDIPLSERQLKRVAKRSTIALGRVGSYCGNGSGDIAIAFTTANRVCHYSENSVLPLNMLHDDKLDPVFEATAEAVEDAILSSLYYGETMVGVRNKKIMGLQDFISRLNAME